MYVNYMKRGDDLEAWGITEGNINGWYTGEKYMFQGGMYPVKGNKQEAKRYTSKKRAENAIRALEKTLATWDYNWEVEKI